MSVPNMQEVLAGTLGAVFLGGIASCILFGVSSLQVYYYYHYYPQDSLLHKLSVGVLWILDATCLTFMIIAMYDYGVTGFGNGEGLDVISLAIQIYVAENVVIILLVQSLYAYRVWILSGFHNGILGYLVMATVLAGFGTHRSRSTVTRWSEARSMTWAISASYATSTAIDVVISIAMCFYLAKSMGEESRIKFAYCYAHAIHAFLWNTYEFFLLPNGLVFLGLTFVLTRLYVNSFMAMMNARQRAPRPAPANAFSDSGVEFSRAATQRSVMMRVGDPESQLGQKAPPPGFDWVDIPTLRFTASPTWDSGPGHPDARGYGHESKAHSEEGHEYAKDW
ncbi:hypothetical protein C8R46DRAFT_1216961 [Mycena filopes]|nr:hypothetical protein C8R46DRAFT_1216961 [Mycena filopes]